MTSEIDALRKERSWLGPLVIGLLLQMLATGYGWITELRSHSQAIDTLQKQVGSLQSEVAALKDSKCCADAAKNDAVVRERLDWIVKGLEELKSSQKKRR